MEEKKFIIWSPDDGEPLREDGELVSCGIIGRVGSDNVYLTCYAKYPGVKRPNDLHLGERITGAVFGLSGSSGTYDIYRVK